MERQLSRPNLLLNYPPYNVWTLQHYAHHYSNALENAVKIYGIILDWSKLMCRIKKEQYSFIIIFELSSILILVIKHYALNNSYVPRYIFDDTWKKCRLSQVDRSR